MRKASPVQCSKCGKTPPFCLPLYQRAYRDEKGRWKVGSDVCRCDKKQFDFLVIGAIERRYKKKGRPVPAYIYKL